LFGQDVEPSDLDNLFDAELAPTIRAEVVSVLELVDAEWNEAAAEDASNQRHAAAHGPVAQANLLLSHGNDVHVASLAERLLRHRAEFSKKWLLHNNVLRWRD